MKKYQITVESLLAITSNYPNEEALLELKAMMIRYADTKQLKHKPHFRFCVDKDGYDAVFVESGTVAAFKLRLNGEIFQWIMKFLLNGEIEESGTKPLELEKSEYADSNEFNTALLQMLVENNTGNIQVVPAFRDRCGKISSIVSFRYGTMSFHIERTEEMSDFLHQKGLTR